ncbi:flavin-containing monooxygenase FMO GS-OX5-like isoform X1 [Primulina eburnea]|uniref:flavin-containing monooxygenase FMO GS-OX5-like isoform X1 n=1 Tax=Primulina eburnea TaxID=1245227 RepID=UPI003C6C0934
MEVAVIGAGVSGLATARALKSSGHRIVVFEKLNQLGGTWSFDPRVESDPLGLDPTREIVHGSLYKSLCTNLPRQLMGFSDYPFPESKNGCSGDYFPGHEEVLKFLTDFAAEFGLVELIRFDCEVVRVEQVDSRNDRWLIESICSNQKSEEIFDAVVVCNGHHTQPRVATLPGIEKWPGKQMHSHNYRVPEPFEDQIVVVIGEGPSAIDISRDICDVAREVHLSSRSPNVEVSKLVSGNNMWQHSMIDYVNENGEVAFQDGALVQADIILHCTGYNYSFPFLKTDGIVNVEDNRVGPLYKHIFPPKLAPNLSFVGLPYQTLVFLHIDLQAKWVSHILSGLGLLPSKEEMVAEVEEHYRQMEAKGIPQHHTHCLHLKFEYLDWLVNQVGLEGVCERVKIISSSYYKFAADNGLWKAKDWKPGNGIKESLSVD